MRIRRPTSKRTSTKMREGIKKKAAATRRKNKKEAKKDVTWKSRVKNNGKLDIDQIPNTFPYKNKIIEELMQEKEAAKLERERRRKENKEKAKLARENGDEEMIVDAEEEEMLLDEDEELEEGGEMNALMAYARKIAKNYDDEDDEDDDEMDEDDSGEEDADDAGEEWSGFGSANSSSESSRKSFDKVFKSVVDAADVILYVLDARDPEGTRSIEVEKSIYGSMDKRLIFVLNKIDLVPPHVQKAWETYLKNFFPVVCVRASSAAPNAQFLNKKDITTQGSATTLLKALKSYANKTNLKRSISVGIIGYPNVGKSSIINALTNKLGGRKTVCPVGAEAGVTTSMREVKLDSKLKLLDSPGIVFPSTTVSFEGMDEDVAKEARLLLLGALPPKQITDAIPAVTILIRRLESVPELWESLMKYYDLPSLMPKVGENGQFDKSTDFLVNVARKRGRIGKGGVPNLQAAAMTVINDWRDGRIQRWVMPPTEVPKDSMDTGVKVLKNKEGKNVEQKEIVQEWAKEFSLDGLWTADDARDDEMED
ncbi:nucleolar GTP-binding protein 2 [Myxozyma melibiosi]|uniref:Nucleolar GTP-binding protein 2 n=1 Tax=Myxozyma melibiosi TaxID=54550 RepID=A0ABR1F4R3_9ASCO